jgi:hypothetical protein
MEIVGVAIDGTTIGSIAQAVYCALPLFIKLLPIMLHRKSRKYMAIQFNGGQGGRRLPGTAVQLQGSSSTRILIGL